VVAKVERESSYGDAYIEIYHLGLRNQSFKEALTFTGASAAKDAKAAASQLPDGVYGLFGSSSNVVVAPLFRDKGTSYDMADSYPVIPKAAPGSGGWERATKADYPKGEQWFKSTKLWPGERLGIVAGSGPAAGPAKPVQVPTAALPRPKDGLTFLASVHRRGNAYSLWGTPGVTKVPSKLGDTKFLPPINFFP
jgi:hypothetical protein